MNFRVNWDALGIGASLACAIHCAILPLVLTSLPLFGINIINNEYFEWGMILLALAIGSYALYHGYKTHHRSRLPIMLFYTGFVFLILKQLLHQYQLWLLLPAVVCIVTAHYLNYRLCASCKAATGCEGHAHQHHNH